jgi:hypothetical protein
VERVYVEVPLLMVIQRLGMRGIQCIVELGMGIEDEVELSLVG